MTTTEELLQRLDRNPAATRALEHVEATRLPPIEAMRVGLQRELDLLAVDLDALGVSTSSAPAAAWFDLDELVVGVGTVMGPAPSALTREQRDTWRRIERQLVEVRQASFDVAAYVIAIALEEPDGSGEPVEAPVTTPPFAVPARAALDAASAELSAAEKALQALVDLENGDHGDHGGTAAIGPGGV